MTSEDPESGNSQEPGVPSSHEHERNTPASPEPGEDRPPRSQRPEWVEDVPRAQQGDRPGSEVDHSDGSEPRHRVHADRQEQVVPEVDDVDPLIPLILAKLEQHLHLPIQLPDADELAELKEKDPAAHKLWLKQVGKQMNHQRFMESAKYQMPLKTIRSAQLAALAALVAVLAFAGYALYLDRPWVAGILAGLDVLGILTIFAGIGQRGDDDE